MLRVVGLSCAAPVNHVIVQMIVVVTTIVNPIFKDVVHGSATAPVDSPVFSTLILLCYDLFLQFDKSLDKSFRSWRTAGNLHIHREYLIHVLNSAVGFVERPLAYDFT